MRQLYNRRATRYDEASNRLFGAMLSGGGQLSDHRCLIIDLTIRRLKDTGQWDRLDVLHVHAALDTASALINWKNPGTFNGTLVDAPTFTADRGYTTDGSNDAINLNFNPSTATNPNYVQDSASFSVWSLTTGQVTNGTGQFDGTDGTLIAPRTTGDQCTFRINQAATIVQTNTDGLGLYTASRTGAGAVAGYKNGVSQQTGSNASTAVNNLSFHVGQGTVGSFSARQIAMAAIGAGRTAAEEAVFYQIMLPYMQTVGAV